MSQYGQLPSSETLTQPVRYLIDLTLISELMKLQPTYYSLNPKNHYDPPNYPPPNPRII